jgi:hypothetical protein
VVCPIARHESQQHAGRSGGRRRDHGARSRVSASTAQLQCDHCRFELPASRDSKRASHEAHDTDTAARQLGPRREEFDAAPICSASASSCTLCAASMLQHSSTPALMSPLSLGGSVTIRQLSCGITSSGREAWMQRRSSRPRSPRWRRVLSNHKGQCPHVVLKFSLRSNST